MDGITENRRLAAASFLFFLWLSLGFGLGLGFGLALGVRRLQLLARLEQLFGQFAALRH